MAHTSNLLLWALAELKLLGFEPVQARACKNCPLAWFDPVIYTYEILNLQDQACFELFFK